MDFEFTMLIYSFLGICCEKEKEVFSKIRNRFAYYALLFALSFEFILLLLAHLVALFVRVENAHVQVFLTCARWGISPRFGAFAIFIFVPFS